MNDEIQALNDDDPDVPATRGAGHQPALTGCPWHDVNEMLQSAGLRPTRQRMALGWLLFGKGARHLTAEMLYEEATLAKVPVSLATVYNTLNQLTDAGLLRQVSVDGTKTYFDTNVTAHHHFYLENNHELVDIPDPHLVSEQDAGCPRGLRDRPHRHGRPAAQEALSGHSCPRRPANAGTHDPKFSSFAEGVYQFASWTGCGVWVPASRRDDV